MPEDYKSIEMRRFAGALAEIRFHLNRLDDILDKAIDRDDWKTVTPQDVRPQMKYDLEMMETMLARLKED